MKQTRTTTTSSCAGRASSTPLPCQQLAQAQAQMLLLAGGQSVVAIETPQLGRVEYGPGNVTDLQRLIDRLAAECAAAGGQVSGTSSGRRRPISVEAWP
jgi:hypothetical protein